MSEKYTIDLMPKLKKEDVVLLKKVDKILAKERKTPQLDYYNKRNLERLENFKIETTEMEINTIEDLLTKYAFYHPAYIKTAHAFGFNKSIPMEIWNLFREDAVKFRFKNILVSDISKQDYYSRNR